jgi:hypothetical protein
MANRPVVFSSSDSCPMARLPSPVVLCVRPEPIAMLNLGPAPPTSCNLASSSANSKAKAILGLTAASPSAPAPAQSAARKKCRRGTGASPSPSSVWRIIYLPIIAVVPMIRHPEKRCSYPVKSPDPKRAGQSGSYGTIRTGSSLQRVAAPPAEPLRLCGRSDSRTSIRATKPSLSL